MFFSYLLEIQMIMYPFNGLSITQYLKYTLDFLTICTIYTHDLIWSPLTANYLQRKRQNIEVLDFIIKKKSE